MRSKQSASAGAKRAPRRDVRRERRQERSAQAQRGILLETAREGDPVAVVSLMRRLELEGYVATEDFAGAEDLADEAMEGESIPELDLDDVDDLSTDNFDEPGDPDDRGSLILGAVEPASEDPLIQTSFSLVVNGGTCAFAAPPWAGCYVPRTSVGQQVVREVSVRFTVLDGLAGWLQRNRASFLRSRDLWDLGPRDMQELHDGRVAVLQKDIIALMDLSSAVSEASFSRFIRSGTLVWDDGVAPLNILFSNAAKAAWVAKSVWLFADGKLTADVLKETSAVRVQKMRATRNRTATSIRNLDFPSFIEYANRRTGTKWSSVLKEYEDRMLMQYAQ